jgi:hypothetical protein
MRQTTTAEVRIDEGKATSSGAARQASHRFGCPRHPLPSNLVVTEAQKRDDGAQQPGNRGNVGLGY